VPDLGKKKRAPKTASSSPEWRARRTPLPAGRLLAWIVLSSGGDAVMVAILVLPTFVISLVQFTSLQKTVVAISHHLLLGVVCNQQPTGVQLRAPFFR
jgi:hypothetical protein